MNKSFFLYNKFDWMLGKQAPDALKESTSGDTECFQVYFSVK